MSYICEFCGGKFSTKTNLNYHQKTAKYCLDKRSIYCPICSGEFTDKIQFQIHTEKCKDKKMTVLEIKNSSLSQVLEERNKMIDNLIKQISSLQDKLENVAVKGATKPTTKTTTNNTLNLLPITKEWVNSNAKYLTQEDVYDGVPGIANFAAKYPLKDRAVVTDASRGNLKIKDENGETIKDNKGRKTTLLIFESIQKHVVDLFKKIQIEKLEQVGDADLTETSIIMTTLLKIANIVNGMHCLLQGKSHDLQGEFVTNLCSIIPTQ